MKNILTTCLKKLREIRASERKFYQKITDIYATAMDYSAEAVTTKSFFKTVQNKLTLCHSWKNCSRINC